MKAVFEKISHPQGLLVFRFDTSHFEFKWHYHPEYELTFIANGSGVRFVGDNYETFEKNDLVLLGSSIPHTWTSEPFIDQISSAVVVQFSEEFITHFINLYDFKMIKKMLELSSKGIYFKPFDTLIQKIFTLTNESEVKQIATFLDVLDDLSKLPFRTLASEFYAPKINHQNESRINKIFNYLKFNFHKNKSIEEMAAMIHLTPSAFCRFFKKTTGKTFSDYINEIRIGKACNLLTETDYPINEIANQIGYGNLAYFNRIFLKKKFCTPKQYRLSQN
jgi:AraC-like DNA-binding protein